MATTKKKKTASEPTQTTMEETMSDTKCQEELAALKTEMSELASEVGILVQAAIEGKLDTRGDPGKFSGEAASIVQGVNNTLDAVIGPLNVAAEYVDRISKGDIPPEITDTYNGDFNEIKNNLNQCITVMNGLLAETDKLIKATVAGQLDTRGDAEGFPGGWGTLVGGVNDLVDAFVAPINVTAEYVDRISKGDIPPEITDTYNGDFNEIKNNLNQCINIMNNLLNETDTLVKAAVDGQLDTRGDASQFPGGWETLVGGVNNLIDAIMEPINEAMRVLDKLAKNDLTIKITGNYHGDHAKIKDALNGAIDSLTSLVGQIKQNADNLASASDQMAAAADQAGKATEEVSSTSQEMAAGADVQAGSAQGATSQMQSLGQVVNQVAKGSQQQATEIDKASTSVGEMSTAAEQMAQNVAAATEASKTAADAALNGSGKASEMVEGMERITTTVDIASQKVADLGARSEEIGKIVAVIDDIAAQTNLLALNAAIEAARAGEHGRGFAVVSDEVRKLAERTVQATKEIANLIENVQKGVAEAVDGMQEGAKEVVAGSQLADEAGKALAEIQEASKHVDEQISQIASGAQQVNSSTNELVAIMDNVSSVTEQNTAASQQMASTSEEVSKSMESIASVAEQNSASTQQVSASAEEMGSQVQQIVASSQALKAMADGLQSEVAVFKID